MKATETLIIAWLVFKGLVLPSVAVASVIIFGFWFGLTGLVPAYLPQPLPPIIIWSVIIGLEIASAYVTYKPDEAIP